MVIFLVEPANVRADGKYQILNDAKGVYFQTDADGGWYIPEEDLVFFKPGQSGHYRIGQDDNGRYLETEKGIFYLGHRDDEALEKNIEAFNRSHNQSSSPPTETKVIIVGRHVIVPVRIKHRGRSLDLNLLLDTGASIITLYKDAVTHLRLPKGQKAKFTTAGGHVISADMVELEEVRFGPYRQNDVLSGVIDYQQAGALNFDGLLGMNALMGLDYRIDYNRQTICWLSKTGN